MHQNLSYFHRVKGDRNLVRILLRDEIFLRRIICEENSSRLTPKSRLKTSDLKRNRGYAVEEMSKMKRLNPKAFTRMFRLDPITFHWLLDKISPDLERAGRNQYSGLSKIDDVIPSKTSTSAKGLADSILNNENSFLEQPYPNFL